jgi:hypothetical protein
VNDAAGPAPTPEAVTASEVPVAPVPALELAAEAERLVRAAEQTGLRIRLMGGVAVWLTSPSVRQPPYARAYRDMDVVVAGRQSRAVRTFLEAEGYVGDRMFNAIHGAQRLIYTAAHGRWSIDVLFDELRMSHRVDLRDRLAGLGPTLPIADILLTKLQIWQVNEKDLGDALCLLADHPLDEAGKGSAPGASDAIEVRRIADVLGADWGFCHTAERNLDRIAELGRTRPPSGATFDGADQADRLRAAIEHAPKSLGWRARARIGERVQWYEEPEEARR